MLKPSKRVSTLREMPPDLYRYFEFLHHVYLQKQPQPVFNQLVLRNGEVAETELVQVCCSRVRQVLLLLEGQIVSQYIQPIARHAVHPLLMVKG